MFAVRWFLVAVEVDVVSAVKKKRWRLIVIWIFSSNPQPFKATSLTPELQVKRF
jgi:hypothetical protein